MAGERLRELLAQLSALQGEFVTEVDKLIGPADGTTVRVKPGDDLAKAMATLTDGGTILMAPGVYNASLVLPPRPSQKIITFKTDASLPASGKRITRDYFDGGGVAVIRGADRFASVITAQNKSAGYAFVGVALHGGNLLPDRTLVDLGSGKNELKTPADRPSNFLFDRCLLIGDPATGRHRGIQANSLNTIVQGCGVYDHFEFGRDSQAIAGWNGTENLTIDNCHLEGGAENVMFGGANSASADMAPKNVRITRSHIVKPLAWKKIAGLGIKALLETKHVRGLYVSGCLIEQNWFASWPNGVALSIKTTNQNDGDGSLGEPWAITENVTIEDCVVRRCGSPFTHVGAYDSGRETQRGRNITLRNILCYDLHQGEWTGDGQAMPITNPANSLHVEHVTIIGNDYSVTNMSQAYITGKATDFRFVGNVLYHGEYGIHAPTDAGKGALDLFFEAPYTFAGNVFKRDPRRTNIMPPGNPVIPEADFDSSFNTDRSVRAGSPIANAVTLADGTLPGANVGTILSKMADPL